MRTRFAPIALLSTLTLATLVQASAPALAQSPVQPRPSSNRAAEEAACSGDATRFCGPEIPDEQRIAACLRANRDKISQACRALLR